MLACDLGVRSCGIAFNLGRDEYAGALALGTEVETQSYLRQHTGSKSRGAGMRFVRFRQWLHALPREIDSVVVEAPMLQGFYATKALLGLESFVEEWCALRGLPMPERVAAPALKKYATGYGRATKIQMRIMVAARWQMTTATDDEADARALHQRTLGRLRDADARLLARYLRSALGRC